MRLYIQHGALLKKYGAFWTKYRALWTEGRARLTEYGGIQVMFLDNQNTAPGTPLEINTCGTLSFCLSL